MVVADQQEECLKRELGPVTAVMIVVNMVIGSGIFFKAGGILSAARTPGLAVLTLLMAGLISMAGGLSAAKLAACYPESGGMITWIDKVFGPLGGFLCGWTFAFIAFPASLAALATAFGQEFTAIFGIKEHFSYAIGFGTLCILAIINGLETKVAGRVGNIFTIAKLLPIMIIIFVALWHNGVMLERFTPLLPAPKRGVAAGLGSALLACMYIYDGWIQVAFIAGDLKKPKRDLPRAIIIGTALLIIIFVLTLVAYLMVLSNQRIINSRSPAVDTAMILLGTKGAKIMGLGIMISILGAMSQNVFVASRVLYTMGVEKKLPFSQKFASLDRDSKTPVFATNFITVLTILYTLSRSYQVLTDLATFSIWIFYSMTFLAVIYLNHKRFYIHPILPWFALAGGFFTLVSFARAQPMMALLSLIAIGLGIPIYLRRRKWFA